jgi:hypothetical protein
MSTEPLDVGLPANMELRDHGTHLEIVRKWRSWQALATVVFMGFFGYMMFGGLLTQPVEDDALPDSLFLAAFAFVAFCALYGGVAGILNSTRILVSAEKLAIRHGPLPWLGNQELAAANLRQLYVKEKASRSNNSTSVHFELHALGHSGGDKKLLGGIQSSEQALFIERSVEKYLGIEDMDVRGEGSRGSGSRSPVGVVADSQEAGIGTYAVATVFGSVFFGVGCWLLVSGYLEWTEARQYMAQSVIARGQVVEMVAEDRVDDPGVVYAPKVTFTVAEGSAVTFTGWGSNPPTYEVGETVRVRYLPPGDDPIIDEGTSIWFGPIIFGVFGSIFALVGGPLLVVSLRRLLAMLRG